MSSTTTKLRLATTAALLALVSSTATSPAAASVAFERSAVVTAIQQLVAAGAPGVVIHASDESGSWSASAGVADIKTGVPAEQNAAFRIASISKMFVSVAVLQLVNEGKLDLDAPVDTYLPGLLSLGNIVTIRELMEHRAGLAATGWVDGYHLRWGFQGGTSELCHRYLDPVAQVHSADQQVYPPGTNWIYANADYTALQLILEKVTGKPYEQVLRNRIITPLGLTHTSFQDGTPVWPSPYLHGYGDYKPGSGNYYDQHLVDNTDCSTYVWGAAASGISTTADLTTFLTALTSGQLLPNNLYQQMIDGILTDPAYPNYFYGLGVEVIHTHCGILFGHSGGSFGYTSELLTNGTRTLAFDMSIHTYRDPINSAFDDVIHAEFCQ